MPEGMTKTRKRLLAAVTLRRRGKRAWETSKFPGIEHKVLYSDPNTGMATPLFRLSAAALAARGRAEASAAEAMVRDW